MGADSKEPRWFQIRQTHLFSDIRPYDAATNLLTRCGISKPAVHLDDIAWFLGVKLRLQDTQPYDGALDMRDVPSEARLWAKADIGPVAQRVAWAHALGHLLLHAFPQDGVRACTWYENMTDPLELEANSFAHGLLVPLWMLDPIWDTAKNADQLATRFVVWPNIIHRRLRLLQD